MTSQKRFLTVPDVAETLNVTVRQVRALLHSGELRGIQVGGRGIWRIESSELEDYISRQYDRTAIAIAEEQFTHETR
ncbi:MAG: DNA-binding protein [Aeromicrobium sp.]|jgi:excisionase family DNA binding protein|nr:MAG: DNA-binding protein [Aeromicrobium sp.]